MKNRKILLIVLGILLSLSLLVGVSYAYYMVTTSQTNKNRLASSCISVSLTNEKNDITLNNAYPITNSEGKKLTPYQFTITNTCNIFISYNVNLEMLEGTDLSTDYIKTMVNSEAPYILSSLDSASTTIDKSTESRTLAQGSLGSGDSVDYALRLWMDENTPLNNDTQDKSLISKIVVVAQPSTYKPSDYVTTLHDAILVNEYGVKNVDNAISKIEAKGEADLSQTAPIIKWIEKTGEGTSKKVVKPALNSINIDDQTSELVVDDTLLKLYKTKTFDEDTSYYTLSDVVSVDPTTLDFNGDIKYYFCAESIYYVSGLKKLLDTSSNRDITIYQVTGATKSSSKTTWNNVDYDTITYNLNLITLTESELEADASDKGLYQGADDYGATYYYRGNVKNNNVYFAGYYWQIVRINGNGTLRLMYNGKEKNAEGLSKSIDGKAYKFNDYSGSPAYIGYMFGNSQGTTFDEMHSNNQNSTIKTIVDSWYKTNIYDKNYSDYIDGSTGFCGDRTVYKGDGINISQSSFYGAYNRVHNNKAQFTCPNIERDMYTVTSSNSGNKSLTYPVGLITSDELEYAGFNYDNINKLSWAYSSNSYWTMTPSQYDPTWDTVLVFHENALGKIFGNWDINYTLLVRPVINLKANVEITWGIGTVNDPYIVKTT